MTIIIPASVIDATEAWEASKNGLPYVYGGDGSAASGGSGDCSWASYAGAASLQGMSTTRRYGSTEAANAGSWENLNNPQGFNSLNLVNAGSNRANVPDKAIFKAGFLHQGGGENSHVASTINRTNWESRGLYKGQSGVIWGGTARAWDDSLFGNFWYLDAKAPDNFFPLPHGYYYGPLTGPDNCISGEAGEAGYMIDGIKYVAGVLGVANASKWTDVQPAVAAFQTANGATADGTINRQTWDAIMTHAASPINPPTNPVVTTPETIGANVLDIRHQLTGSDAGYTGWSQLGNRTLVDAIAAIGVKLGIDGFHLP